MDVLVVGVESEDQDALLGVAALDVRDGFRAIRERHGHVHHHEVGIQYLRGTYGFAAVGGGANHLQVRFAIDEGTKPIAHDAVVISHHNGFLGRLHIGSNPGRIGVQ